MSTFRYDIHAHTKETSHCGWIPAAELVSQYIALGYNGIAITDHLHDEYINTLACKDDWNACVDAYLEGFKTAKNFAAEVSRNSFDVILGMEIRYPENDNDYLVFGIDEEFLRENPYPYQSTPQDFYKKHGSKLIIIQAHPFRDGCYPVAAHFLHGVEIHNGNPRHDSKNDNAAALAKENPRLLQTCGSDTHRDGDAGRAAILFDKRIKDSYELLTELVRNKYVMEY
jgi:predicted metal-dependent phosphoesterase TrpH